MKKLSIEDILQRLIGSRDFLHHTDQIYYDELLSRLSNGKKAIEAMEKIRQHIPLGDRLVPLTSIYDIVDIFKAYDKE